MAKQNQNQDRAVADEQQPSKYRINENMIDWDDIQKKGISREYLEQKGFLNSMLNRQKTNELVPVFIKTENLNVRMDARLSFIQGDTGRVTLNIHALKQHPEFTKPFMGHNFSDEDKKSLLSCKTSS